MNPYSLAHRQMFRFRDRLVKSATVFSQTDSTQVIEESTNSP